MQAGERIAARRPGVGERLEIEIVDLNHDGEGVGRSPGGFVLFAAGALPGDRAVVEVTAVHSRHGEAKLLELVAASPDRTQPMCPVAGVCGGCALMHMAYPAQLRWKEERVRQALARIGRLEGIAVAPIVGMEHPFHYRNKAQYPLARVEGRTAVGFYRRRSHEVVPAEDCLIQHPLAVAAAKAARDVIDELGLSVYDETAHAGFARHIVVRVSFSREECMAILVTREREFPMREAFVAGMRRRVPQLVSVVQNVNPARTNVILGPEWILLWGKPYLVERLGHREFVISPGSFFQVNPEQAKRLYDAVAAYAALKPGDTVWDVYCGTGSIGLYVAAEGVRLRGVERAPEAVQDAWRNARHNGVEDARFEAASADEALPRWVSEGERADVIVLDPPRSGSDERTLAAVAEVSPRRIVYVSCNPATLARDLAFLSARGFQVQEVQPFDMFPHTPHVEAVALLLRK